MQYDEETHKLLFFANAYPCLCGVSFDIESKKTVHIYDHFTKSTLANGSFSNGDGTYTMRFHTERSCLYKWNPKEETLTLIRDIDEKTWLVKSISDSNHNTYVPLEGWMTPDGNIVDGPKPEQEMMVWFGKTLDKAYGVTDAGDGSDVYEWNFADGKVKVLCHVANATVYDFVLTKNQEILSVTTFGEFYKFDKNGTLLLSKFLESDSPGIADCMIRLDDHRIIGTPFIAQRFWMLNTETNEGIDAGRAATKCGEVILLWNMGGKVYMASYTEGMLTEYNPNKLISFPENPHIVAQAPGGMRPVADTQDEECLYYSSNHKYGILGCVLTRYNTKTGEASYHDNPIDYENIIALVYDKKNDCLFASTTYRSDCDVSEPKSDVCHLLKIDKNSLQITNQITLPMGTVFSYLIGSVDENNYLLSLVNKDDKHRICLFNTENQNVVEIGETYLEENNIKQIKHAKKQGYFITLSNDNSISLWHFENNTLVKEKDLLKEDGIYCIFPEDNGVLAANAKHVFEIKDIF